MEYFFLLWVTREMADADEIPVSEAEQAFFDAMKATHDIQETQAATDEVVAPATTTSTTSATAETNGHEHEGDRERPTTQEEQAQRDVLEVNRDDTPATSARSSAVPSVASPTTSAAIGAPTFGVLDSSSVVPVSITIQRDEIQETTPSLPPTPTITQQPSNWGTPTKAAQSAAQVAPTQKTTTGGKRKRLPQDLVGQLEDRIADNPRGDVDAWLSLIEEHKRKGKFDDARAVYERFFVIFPQAVSLPPRFLLF